MSSLIGNYALAQVSATKKDTTKKATAGGALDAAEHATGAKATKAAKPAKEVKEAKKEPEAVEVVETPETSSRPTDSFKQLPVDETLKKDSSKINPILMNGKFASGENGMFDEFYEKYWLARWTQPKNIGNLPTFRKELRSSHLGKKSANTEVHDHLNALLLDLMNRLATDDYHPAVRVNAMLMIGELNSVEMPPTPWPDALDVLTRTAENTKLPDAVQAAAMVGIRRHVAAGIQDDARKSLTAALLKLAAADMPRDTAEAGREWILAQTVESLGYLGSVGENNAVFKIMMKTLADVKLGFSARTSAVESLGRLNYQGVAGINVVETAASLGQFAIDACNEELRLVKETERPVSRRRMKERLGAVEMALVGTEEENRKGIALLAHETNRQAFLGNLQKSVEKALAVLDDKKIESDDLETPIEALRTSLETWLKEKPQ